MPTRKTEPLEIEPEAVPAAPVDERLSRIIERPDGYHWIDVAGRQEFGPFDTLEAALADMDEPDDMAQVPRDEFEDVEHELGLDPQQAHSPDADEPPELG